ncbi:MAG: hypothetical protein GY940_01990, partial [bacterium]|nr:hypothetical protein [bacterium]
MKKNVIYVILLIFTSLSLFPLSVNIRSYDHAAFTRVVFESDRGFEFKIDPSSDYALDLKLKKKVEVSRDIEVFRRSALVDRVVHRWEDGNSVFRVHMKSGFKMKRNFVLERPFRVVLDLEKSPVVSKSQKPPIPNPEPEQKTNQEPPQDPGKDNQNGQDNEQSNGENETQDEGQEDDAADETGKEKPSLPNQPKKRPLIDTICIDPGHGGTDLGAVGPSKIPEKNITLDIGKKVKRMIVSKLGLSVVMTRETDEEVSLNSRVSKANNR